MLFNIFEFIYNNLLIISVIGLSLFGAYVLGHKWYEEVKMNKRLNTKKTMLRNLKEVTFRLPSLKRTLGVFVPVVFLGLFFLVSFEVPKDYTNHLRNVENKETFMSLYETFNEKFYSTPLQSTNVLETPSKDADKSPDTSKMLFEGLDYVTYSEGYIYVADNLGINVISETNKEFQIDKTISFSQIEDGCTTDPLDFKGMAVHEDKLIYVGYSSQTQCPDRNTVLLKSPRTIIRIFDIDEDFTLTNEYSVSGHLDEGRYEDGQLIFATNTFIPLNPEESIVDSYLPHITHNGDKKTMSLKDIRYIENTNPNTFLSFTLIDVQTGHYDFETTLTDYKYVLEMTDGYVYLTTNAYEFNTSAEVFEMQNPIDSIHTIISKFSIRDDEIRYSQTKKHENVTTPFDSMIVQDEDVFILFEADGYTLYWLNSNIEIKDKVKLPPSKTYDSMKHINDSILLYEEDNPNIISEIKLTSNQLINLSTPDIEKVSIDQTYGLTGSNMRLSLSHTGERFAIDLLTEEGSVVDSYNLDLNRFSVTTPLESFDAKTMSVNEQTHTFFIPLVALQDNSNYHHRENVIKLLIRDEREIMVESMIELKNIHNPLVPFEYRHLVIGEEDYHITPGGIFVTDNTSEVVRKFKID